MNNEIFKPEISECELKFGATRREINSQVFDNMVEAALQTNDSATLNVIIAKIHGGFHRYGNPSEKGQNKLRQIAKKIKEEHMTGSVNIFCMLFGNIIQLNSTELMNGAGKAINGNTKKKSVLYENLRTIDKIEKQVESAGQML